MQEVSDSLASIEQELAALKSETNDNFGRVGTDLDNTEQVLNAKVDDLGDRLRLGMNKLQAAVGKFLYVDKRITVHFIFLEIELGFDVG